MDDMPQRESTALVAHSANDIAEIVDAAATAALRQARAPIARSLQRESRAAERARHAAQADRHCGRRRADRLCAALARHHLLSQLSASSRPHAPRCMPTTACSTSSSAIRACRRTRSISSSRTSTAILHKVVASKSETDKFVNDTILMLDDERARIKQAAHEDLDRTFALAFQDREQCDLGLRRLVLRVEALLRGAEGDRSARPSPASSRPANTSR